MLTVWREKALPSSGLNERQMRKEVTFYRVLSFLQQHGTQSKQRKLKRGLWWSVRHEHFVPSSATVKSGLIGFNWCFCSWPVLGRDVTFLDSWTSKVITGSPYRAQSLLHTTLLWQTGKERDLQPKMSLRGRAGFNPFLCYCADQNEI